MPLDHLESSLERLLASVSGGTAQILDNALSGNDITVDEAVQLFDADGSDLLALIAAADQLRSQTVGDVVTYVINRNINFTNVCVKGCGFCAFSRGHLAEEGYFLPMDEILRRAQEARDLGATEVCVQAGLAPGMDGWQYVNLCRALKNKLPDMHIHGFSPEEVLYGSTLTGVTIKEYLSALKEAGVGSLPGTSAEVLIQECAVVMTSSPGIALSAFKASQIASVPLAQDTQCLTSAAAANSRSKRSTCCPRMKEESPITEAIASSISPLTVWYCRCRSANGTGMTTSSGSRAGDAPDFRHRCRALKYPW